MAYSNACFISYKRPPQNMNLKATAARSTSKHVWLQFVEKFEKLLIERLTTPLNKVFRDHDLRFDPGKLYPAELSENLCRSVCMVALLVPEYIESSWCVGEWQAMEKLEAERLGSGQHGLLIPVIFQGKEENLAQLFGTRQFTDLRGIRKPSQQLDTVKNLELMDIIADKINGYVKKFAATNVDCHEFKIPVNGVEVNTPRIVEPSPFQR